MPSSQMILLLRVKTLAANVDSRNFFKQINFKPNKSVFLVEDMAPCRGDEA